MDDIGGLVTVPRIVQKASQDHGIEASKNTVKKIIKESLGLRWK